MFSENYANRLNVNIWTFVLAIGGMFLLFVLINWAVCTLFDGKGTMANIYIYSSYSLLPVIVLNYLYVCLSYVLTLNESTFLNLLNVVFILWTAILLLRGLSILHEYSLKQVVLSIISTVFGIAIVVFLMMLAVSLFNKLGSFITSVVNEFILHSQR